MAVRVSGEPARRGGLLRCIAVAAALLCAGCAHETLLRASKPTPPWDLLTPPPPKGDQTLFIGRSLAVNILDERQGIESAINDAAYQIALAASANVGAQVTLVDQRTGEAIRGRERSEQPDRSKIQVDVSNILIGLRHVDTYWERWSIRESFLGPEFARTKFYVLVSFPTKELERLSEDLKKS
jgi:hypothetical protein